MTLPHESGRDLAVDTLRSLPFLERMIAYDDFDTAHRSRRLAHWYRRGKGIGWSSDFHLEMRRALRAWSHYADAVRKAKSWRVAA